MLIRFVLALLLALAPGASWAGEHFYDLDHAVHLHPNVNEPYINIYLCFYDTNGKDGFFTHDGGGPAIYVDGHLICNADWELAWPETAVVTTAVLKMREEKMVGGATPIHAQ